jgi:ribosome maturation factor RimP
VSSPGVDRPLTEPRHWRRARGRLVKVKLAGTSAAGGRTLAGTTVQGRVLAADADGVTLDLADGEQRFGYGELGAGAIQVEFGRIPDSELEEFSEVPDDEADLGAGGDGH